MAGLNDWRKGWTKDRIGATMLIVLGVAVLWLGVSYKMGSLNHMGAGFIPVVLGALLILVGLAIGITAAPSGRAITWAMTHPLPCEGHHGAPEWRGWACILGGVIAFVLFGLYGGLVPATFASVFIAAMGDRHNTVKSAALLSAVITVFGVIVFHYGLKLQLALFSWG